MNDEVPDRIQTMTSCQHLPPNLPHDGRQRRRDELIQPPDPSVDTASSAKRRRLFTRRSFALGCGGLLGFGVLGGGAIGGVYAASYQGYRRDTVGDMTFANPLDIPPLLDGTLQDDGTHAWDLRLQTGTTRILPGRETPTWGANGAFLAPTLRARRGQTVRASVRNDLPEATTIHWHGMHLPPAMDGSTHQMVRPGETWSPWWEVTQPAATLWYHPHPHGATFLHVYRGIAGMILIEDDVSPAAGLPNTYGVDDIPLIIQDKLFDGDAFRDTVAGTARFLGGTDTGMTGDTILVNGTYDPFLDVTAERVRFRLLNGSNARSYNLGLSDEREFLLVATENGLLPEPVPLTRLMLAPGERAEIVVGFAPGDDVVLRSTDPDLGTGFPNERWWGGDDRFDLVRFRAASTLTSSLELPERIAVDSAETVIPLPDDVRTRRFRLSGHRSINDREFDMMRVDEVVAAGSTEIWEVSGGGIMHTFHIHGASFRVLDIDGEAPPAHIRGLKDTIYVEPSRTYRLLVRFPDIVDPVTPYMYHCHLLRHEDNGMMGQYVVVRPGEEDATPRTLTGTLPHAAH